jgi:hypothetical protein
MAEGAPLVCHPRPIDGEPPLSWAPNPDPEPADRGRSASHLTLAPPLAPSPAVREGPSHGGAGWHPDPREPGRRLRWWDGATWTVRVVALEADSEGISWHASMADLAPPVAHATIPSIAAVSEDAIKWTLPSDEPELAEVVVMKKRPRRWVMAVAAAAMVALAAGAGAAILPVGDQTPTVEPTLAYRDAAAGFALRYPDHWSKGEATPGEAIRFDVGERNAPPSKSNTVTVAADTTPSPFPVLHELANEVTSRLRDDFPDMRLESAEEIQLLHAPAYQLRLVDESSTRSISVEQIVGQTTDGRLVKITVTVREPRNAPTSRELNEFLASITGISSD